jgi:hypothetical protein
MTTEEEKKLCCTDVSDLVAIISGNEVFYMFWGEEYDEELCKRLKIGDVTSFFSIGVNTAEEKVDVPGIVIGLEECMLTHTCADDQHFACVHKFAWTLPLNILHMMFFCAAYDVRDICVVVPKWIGKHDLRAYEIMLEAFYDRVAEYNRALRRLGDDVGGLGDVFAVIVGDFLFTIDHEDDSLVADVYSSNIRKIQNSGLHFADLVHVIYP